ncbi:MAG: hypothetical protein QMD50_03600 [Patescibacteria group bacterium]|nr:hypothetical protein [Patescibacteria group bacterium]
MAKAKLPEVIIQKKSKYQKSDCLFCDNDSVFEAVCGNIASIRCCRNKACKELAKKLARQALERVSNR